MKQEDNKICTAQFKGIDGKGTCHKDCQWYSEKCPLLKKDNKDIKKIEDINNQISKLTIRINDILEKKQEDNSPQVNDSKNRVIHSKPVDTPLSEKKRKWCEVEIFYPEDVKQAVEELKEDIEMLYYEEGITWANWKREVKKKFKQIMGEFK